MKSRNHHIPASFCLCVCSGVLWNFSMPAVAGEMSLNEAIVRAVERDPVIRKVGADIREAAGFEREMKSDLLPQVRLEGSAGYANRDRSIDGVATGGDDLFSRQISLIGEQLLWDSGFHWYRWKDAEKRREGEVALEKAQRETTALLTVESYLDVVRARKQIQLAKENLAVHDEVRNLAKDRADAAGNQADIELSSARYDLALTLLRERELALMQAEAAFVRYVGISPPDGLKVPGAPSIASKESIDPTGNFHYQAALLQKEAAGLAKKAIEKRYSPRFLFRGEGGLGEDVLGIRGEDNELSALVVVQWDLFESGRKKGLMEQALADLDRQAAIIDETLVLLNQDIDARWADYSTSKERIGILRRYEEELGKTAKVYEEQFELGTRPLLSMLDIKNEQIGASIRLTDEQHDFAMLSYRLLSFGGRLISETVGEDYLVAPTRSPEVGHESFSVEESSSPAAEEVPPSAPDVEEKRPFRPFGFLRKNRD